MGRTSPDYNKRWRAENPDKVAAWRPRQRAQARAEYFRRRTTLVEAYGNGCTCCGEGTIAFLTLDHIDGVPDDHRDANGKRLSSNAIQRMLWKLLPVTDPRMTVLCFNCNSGRAANGGVCPHKEVMP